MRFQQAGQTLVFDYFPMLPNTQLMLADIQPGGQWSIFQFYDTGSSACVWMGGYVYLNTVGVVQQETIGAYSDPGGFISMGFTTSWISLAQMQGFQRIRRILLEGSISGDPGEQALVGVTLNFDYQPISPLAAYVPDFTPVPLSSTTSWQERIHMPIQKCEAIQIVFSESVSGANTPYLDLTSITLEVAIKGGAYRLPAAQSTG